jgi:hypothetical protein
LQDLLRASTEVFDQHTRLWYWVDQLWLWKDLNTWTKLAKRSSRIIWEGLEVWHVLIYYLLLHSTMEKKRKFLTALWLFELDSIGLIMMTLCQQCYCHDLL